MQLTDFSTLSFDCYGTLIDWETGIADTLRPWAVGQGLELDDEALLVAFAAAESRLQQTVPDMPYPALLEASFAGLAEELGRPAGAPERAAFAQSVADWPAFADSPAALAYLKRHYRLVILSNVDNRSFGYSNRRLGVEFDLVLTAQDIGAYKPDPRNFRALIDRLAELGVAKGRILHVAQSLFHDHVPAKRAGLATCWINRRLGKQGGGATFPPPERVTPDWEFPSLEALADRHRELVGG